MKIKHHRAFTLVEMLIAAFLLIIFLSIFYQFVTRVYRIAHEEFERAGVESTLLTIVTKFQADTRVASASGLTLTLSGKDVVFHPATISDTGQIAHKEQLFFWHFDDATEELKRFTAGPLVSHPFTGEPLRLPEGDLPAILSSSEVALSNRYSGIKEFRFRNAGSVAPPLVSSPLELVIKADVELAQARKTIEMRRTIHMRQSGK